MEGGGSSEGTRTARPHTHPRRGVRNRLAALTAPGSARRGGGGRVWEEAWVSVAAEPSLPNLGPAPGDGFPLGQEGR